MQINYSAELKKSIALFNRTKNQEDFNNIIPALVNARLNLAVSTENLKNSGNTSAALMKNAEFYGVFMRTQRRNASYLVAFTDEEEMRKGGQVLTLSMGIKEYCEAFENTNANGILVNPFSKEYGLFLSRNMVVNEMLPAVRRAAAIKGAETGSSDGKLLYQGSYFMEFKTLPAEFFKDSGVFVDELLNNKEEFIKRHLMMSQLMVCRKQDEIDGITGEKLKRERADRVMIAKGRAFSADDYFFTAVSEDYPKMYMLDFPPQMQIPVLCKRIYFVIGANGKKAVYTVEASYNGKQFLGEIARDYTHANLGEIAADSPFDETKRILELFSIT